MAHTAVVAGVGPGLGESIARRFAEEGCSIGLLARTESYVTDLAEDLPTDAVGVPCDLADPAEIRAAIDAVRDDLGPIDVLVNHASGGGWKGLGEQTVDEFDRAYAVAARGGFVASQEVLPDMRQDGGTIIFTGATSAVRGRGGSVGFSASKFAVRGLAESMARELGPEGIHVAHVVIDGQILTPDAEASRGDRPREDFLDPDAIAESYWHLVCQDRSAWTLELDLRPHVEEF